MSVVYKTGLPASMDRKNREWEAKPEWLKNLYGLLFPGFLILWAWIWR